MNGARRGPGGTTFVKAVREVTKSAKLLFSLSLNGCFSAISGGHSKEIGCSLWVGKEFSYTTCWLGFLGFGEIWFFFNGFSLLLGAMVSFFLKEIKGNGHWF